MSYLSYPQAQYVEQPASQYRQFHETLISPSQTSKGRIYSGKEYCPNATPAQGKLDEYKSVQRPRSTYAAYDAGTQRQQTMVVSDSRGMPVRIAYNSNSINYGSLMSHQALTTSRPSSTYTAVEAGNTYTRSLGGVQWIDDEARQPGAIIGVQNLYTGEQQVQCEYPYSSRATRASYGDAHLVGEKFWRDPYGNSFSRGYRNSTY